MSRRISELPLSGKVSVRRSAKISATSGTWIKPPSPTTSTGIFLSRRACSISPIYFRERTKTANVWGSSGSAVRSGANQYCSKCSAIAVASIESVSNWPQSNSPLPALGRSFNRLTLAALPFRLTINSPMRSTVRLAISRIFSSLRQVVSKLCSIHFAVEFPMKALPKVSKV
ncbi:unannotated protein [freshwater metagenome]|uniref:Unannotated protein n=1 Tax=freshwater metagenome TaxID=449393 RepID=A0A6J6SQM8_9ZZZZ